jgi:hypothetical protein
VQEQWAVAGELHWWTFRELAAWSILNFAGEISISPQSHFSRFLSPHSNHSLPWQPAIVGRERNTRKLASREQRIVCRHFGESCC